MSGMTVAITGASGFVGRALTPALRDAGYTVRTVGRGSSSDVRMPSYILRARASASDGRRSTNAKFSRAACGARR
jgi:nucleoside-diphosphate-sugar epimerase